MAKILSEVTYLLMFHSRALCAMLPDAQCYRTQLYTHLSGGLGMYVHRHMLTLTFLCHLLITFSNSLDPVQARQNIRPDLVDTLMIFLKEFFEKIDVEKISRRQKHMKNYPVGRVTQKFIYILTIFPPVMTCHCFCS